MRFTAAVTAILLSGGRIQIEIVTRCKLSIPPRVNIAGGDVEVIPGIDTEVTARADGAPLPVHRRTTGLSDPASGMAPGIVYLVGIYRNIPPRIHQQ